MKKRADLLLVERGLVESRSRAAARDPGRQGLQRRASHRQGGRSAGGGRAAGVAGPGPPLGLARRAEARPCARSFRHRSAGSDLPRRRRFDRRLHRCAARPRRRQGLCGRRRPRPARLEAAPGSARVPARGSECPPSRPASSCPRRPRSSSATPASSALRTVLAAPLALAAADAAARGADQAAVRGRPRGRGQGRDRARSGLARGGLRPGGGMAGAAAGLADAGHHRKPHHRRGRQCRISDRRRITEWMGADRAAARRR